MQGSAGSAVSGISVRGLTVVRAKQTVLEDVSFSMPEAALTAVLGPAGAGKTSLLAALAGMLPLDRGAVFRGSRDITRLPPARRGIAWLEPGTALAESRPLQTALRRFAARGATARADDMLFRLGLSAVARQTVGLLSHGQSLAALTAARLIRTADVLLVDEAGMGLDAAAAAALTTMLRQEAADGRIVLVATRSAAMALQADHLVLLSGGRVLQAGTPASLYAEPRDTAAAHLTGPANIVEGHVRELRPGGFIWARGGRYQQSCEPGLPRPALGSPVTLCLRPERITLLAYGEAADIMADSEILDVRSADALLDVRMESAIGPLTAAVPSWRPPVYPRAGQFTRVGWAATAACVMG